MWIHFFNIFEECVLFLQVAADVDHRNPDLPLRPSVMTTPSRLIYLHLHHFYNWGDFAVHVEMVIISVTTHLYLVLTLLKSKCFTAQKGCSEFEVNTDLWISIIQGGQLVAAKVGSGRPILVATTIPVI